MTELEFVLENFEKHFASFCGKKILLHGSREYACSIIEKYDDAFHFLGIMTLDSAICGSFQDKEVFQKEDLADLKPDLIILTERVKYETRAFDDLKAVCEELRISIMNMYGVNEELVQKAYETDTVQTDSDRFALLDEYDVIGFETMDTFFSVRSGEIYKPVSRAIKLCKEAQNKKKTVFFSLRKSYDAHKQIQALAENGFTEENAVIVERKGEDLSFRTLSERYPQKKILYFCSGFTNEYLLPRYYGIRTVHLFFSVTESMNYLLSHYQEPQIQDAEEAWNAAVKAVEEHDVISFDIFDTLVCRRVLYPDDIFRLIAQQVKRRFNIDPEKLYECRKAAEHSRSHVELTEVWQLVLKMLERTDIAAEELERIELDTERRYLCPREKTIGLMNYANNLDKTVVLTSDMYICAEKLRELLRSVGITKYEKIFVSVDHHRFKTDGLFEIVQSSYPQKRILHFGDNYEADIISAEACGIDAIHVSSVLQKAVSCGLEAVLKNEYSLEERCLLGMALSEGYRDPFSPGPVQYLSEEQRINRFASVSCFPMLAGFLSYLVRKAKGKDGILFAARDGYLLNAMYSEFRKLHKDLPTGIYLYTNRHSSFLTCMDDPQTIVKTYTGKGQDMASWLKNVYGISDPLPYKAGMEKEEYVLLHWKEIQEGAEKARRNTMRYLKNNRIDPDKKYLFVDFVSIGTTQYYLASSTGLNAKACYLACPLYGEPYSDIDYYLTDQDNSFVSNFMEMEYIMTSPEPSLDRFDEEGKPVFAKESRSDKDLRQITAIQTKIVQLFKEYLRLFGELNGEIDSTLLPKLYAAEGYHGIIRERGFDDWIKYTI